MKKELCYAIALVLAVAGIVGCKEEQKKHSPATEASQTRKTDDAKRF